MRSESWVSKVAEGQLMARAGSATESEKGFVHLAFEKFSKFLYTHPPPAAMHYIHSSLQPGYDTIHFIRLGLYQGNGSLYQCVHYKGFTIMRFACSSNNRQRLKFVKGAVERGLPASPRGEGRQMH